MTTDDVRALLKEACRKAGSQNKWAAQHGVTAAYLSDVIRGKREPAQAICDALGLQRTVTTRVSYTRVRK